MRVLIVEDNGLMAQMITAALSRKGFNPTLVQDTQSALDQLLAYEFDAVVLDMRLKGESGLDLLSRARRTGIKTPVLILSGDLETDTKVATLRAGADDYMTKPFKPEELAARLTAIIRRTNGHDRSEIRIGALSVLLDTKEARVGESVLNLTTKEYDLLETLALRKGQPVTKETILTKLYGGRDEPDSKIIDVFICKLRKKLSAAMGDSLIRTVWSRGYAIGEAQSSVPLLEMKRLA
jgi:two-component system, cell cycle response regulator CtrA